MEDDFFAAAIAALFELARVSIRFRANGGHGRCRAAAEPAGAVEAAAVFQELEARLGPAGGDSSTSHAQQLAESLLICWCMAASQDKKTGLQLTLSDELARLGKTGDSPLGPAGSCSAAVPFPSGEKGC